MKYLWLTDIHLNFLERSAMQKFHAKICACQSDAVFITGDIAEALRATDDANNTFIIFCKLLEKFDRG